MDWSPEGLKKRFDLWLKRGGAKALFEAHQRAEVDRQQVRDALRVDYSTLDKPMTV